MGIWMFAMLAGGAWAAAPGASEPAPSGAAELENAASATPEQMVAFAADAARRVTKHHDAVTRLTAEAQDASDPDLLACLIPKKTSLAALEQVVGKSRGAIQQATADFSTDNEKLARYHYRVIAVSLSRAFGLQQAAEACTSRTTHATGQTQIVVTGGVSEDGDEFVDDPLDGIRIGWNWPPPSRYIP